MDLVADDGRPRITEQQMEHPAFAVEPEAVTRGDGTSDTRRDVTVETHLAFVQAKGDARLPADRVAGGNLQHDRSRSGLPVGVGQRDAVALAHLAGSDPVA